MTVSDVKQDNYLLLCMKAMADENRLRILHLCGQDEKSVNALAHELDISTATVSHHLSKLREAGLLNIRSQGTSRLYLLNEANVKRVSDLMLQIKQRDFSRPVPQDSSWIDELPLSDADKKVLHNYTEGKRFKQLPMKESKLLSVLRFLVTLFESDRRYTEKEINAIISEYHPDYAGLRRDLIGFGYMRRQKGGGEYWLTPDDE